MRQMNLDTKHANYNWQAAGKLLASCCQAAGKLLASCCQAPGKLLASLNNFQKPLLKKRVYREHSLFNVEKQVT